VDHLTNERQVKVKQRNKHGKGMFRTAFADFLQRKDSTNRVHHETGRLLAAIESASSE
jgi:hypothetical protein